MEGSHRRGPSHFRSLSFATQVASRFGSAAVGLILLAMLVSAPGHPASAATAAPHVMMVLMENNSYEAIVGNSQLPYINSLVNQYGSVSTTDLSHPSLPNYLGLTSGSIWNDPPDTTPQDQTYAGPQFTDELANAGISWKAYMEDMPVPCDLTDSFSPGNYDVNHDPFMYYDSVRNNSAQCNRVVPFPQLASDLAGGTTPSFVWVTPNLLNDMHNGTYAQADSWTKDLFTQVMGSSWWTPGARIILTWDEGTQSEQVLTVVVGSAHGTQAIGGNEYGTLRGLEEAYSVGLLQHSADSNVGDIFPLLTGAPPPSPSPSPSPVASPSPSPNPTPAPAGTATRGIYRFDSTDFAAMRAAGFNAATDGGVQSLGDAEAAAGITGMVWVGAYDNSTCVQTLSDAEIAQTVTANVSAGHVGLRYQIGDEPTANGCTAAPVYTHITQVVHSADPTAKTWVADDQFQAGNPVLAGVPMNGTVDILAFDVYPCQSGPCDYSAIDSAVQQIHAANVTNWEFIIQDFSSGSWRWPTPAEVQAQFSHWGDAGAIGYWVFAWDYQAQLVTAQSGNVAALQTINALAVNPALPSPSPSPTTPPLVVTNSASITSGPSPLTITFAASASGGAGPYSYQWTFGDGQSSSSQNPSHTYTINAQYTVNLLVTDANQALGNATAIVITVTPALSASASVLNAAGDGSLAAVFTGSPAGGAGPYTFAWSFGDAQSSTAQSPSHTYGAVGAYTADLTVTDSRGVSATSNALAITVSAMPAATAAANVTALDAPEAVGFTSAVKGGTAPFGYQWIFGDGSASIAQDPSHAYATAGTYTVGLTVTDAVGTSFVANSLTINVHPSLGVVASATPTSGLARLKVTFVAAATGGLGPFTYSWSFGDGATGTGPNVAHTYEAGTYQPTLTVHDAAGGSWQGSVGTITVVKHSPKRTA